MGNSWEKIWKSNFDVIDKNIPSTNLALFHKYHLSKIKKKNLKILDHGCGNGRNFSFLKKKGYDVYGTDISDHIIKKNKMNLKNKNKFFTGTLKEINFNKNFFDAILSDASLYYQKKNIIFEEISEFYRIMKKGALIRVYTKSIYDNFYFEKNRNVKNSFEYRVKLNHWEKNLTMTFLDLKDIKKLFSKFKDVKIGIEEFNFTNFKKKHSYWVITAKK